MNPKAGYKETEIGEIPEEWEVVSLGDEKWRITKVIMGQSPPSSSYSSEKDGLPFLQGNAEFGAIYPIPQLYTSRPMKMAEKHDILISVRAPVGEVNLAPFKCCIGRGLAAIRTNQSKLDTIFAFHYFKDQIRRILRLATGSTFKAIRKEDLTRFLVAIPPLPEQQKIASILSTVDEAVQRTDEVISKTEELKRGLMQRSLTRGIGHTRFKETEIGEIPVDWRIERLGKIISELKSGFASGARDDNGIIQLRMNNISKDGRVLLNSYLKVPIPKNVSDYLLKDGDVLFNNTNSVDLIGKSAIFREEIMPCTFSNHLTRLRVNPNKVIPEWLLYHLVRRWEQHYFHSICNRHVGQAGIRADDIRRIRLPITLLDEQRKVASILSAVDKKIEKESEKRRNLKQLKRGLMQVLLSGKVRVKLG